MVKRILSVDFDFFYPDSAPYDWGHSEHYSPLMANMLWHARCGNINLMSGEDALESYAPTVPEDFWARVLLNQPPAYVADSHLSIWDVLEDQPGSSNTIVSFDAHHDCGYGDYRTLVDVAEITYVDCGNWGLHGKLTGRIKSLQLHYPEWRRKARETLTEVHTDLQAPSKVSFGLPGKPDSYDLVFVCRSGAWTPPGTTTPSSSS